MNRTKWLTILAPLVFLGCEAQNWKQTRDPRLHDRTLEVRSIERPQRVVVTDDHAITRQIYDVRDLVFARTEFIAPRLSGLPTGDEDTARSGREGEERVPSMTLDDVVEFVKLATDPNYWNRDPNASIDTMDSGFLWVSARRSVHARIRQVLGA